MDYNVNWQVVDVPLVGGLDTKTDDKLVENTKLRDAINVTITKKAGLTKRNGTIGISLALTTGGNLPEVKKLYKRGDELLAVCVDNHLYKYVASFWYKIGRLLPFKSLQEVVAHDSYASVESRRIFPTGSSYGGLSSVTWYTTNLNAVEGVQWQINLDDSIPFTMLRSDSYFGVPICFENSVVGVFFEDVGLVSNVNVYTWDKATPNDLPVNQVDTNALDLDERYFDWCRWPGGNAAIFYEKSSGMTFNTTCNVISPDGSSLVIYSILPGASTSKVSVCFCVDHVAVLKAGYIHKLNTDGSIGFSTQLTLDNQPIPDIRYYSVTYKPTTQEYVVFGIGGQHDDELPGNRLFRITLNSIGQQTSEKSTLRHDVATLTTKAFTSNNNGYITCLVNLDQYVVDSIQKYYLVINEDLSVDGQFLYGSANEKSVIYDSAFFRCFTASYVETLDNRAVAFTVSQNPLNRFTDIRKLTIDYSSYADAVDKNNIMTSGGTILYDYDGSKLAESAFLHAPEGISYVLQDFSPFVPEATPTVFPVDTTYSYLVRYQAYDQQGNRVLSGAIPFTVAITGGAYNEIKLTIPTMKISTRRLKTSIVVYRTKNGGTTYYRVSSPNPFDSNAIYNRFLINNPSLATVEFVDILSDTQLDGKEIDFLASGELDNFPTGSGSILRIDKNRIFYSDSKSVYFSKLFNDRATEYNSALSFGLDVKNEPITSFEVMDDSIVVFKSDSVWLVEGTGPDNLGVGNFGEPRKIAPDIGVSDNYLTVVLPTGIIFKSHKGYYFLQRGSWQIGYIGADVEAYNDAQVTASVRIDKDSLVLFTLADQSALVYDYLHNHWFRFVPFGGKAAVLVDGRYYFYRQDSVLLQMDDVPGTDDGDTYAVSFKSPWFTAQNIQGLYRVRRMGIIGRRKGAASVRISTYYNYSQTPDYSIEFNPDNAISTPGWGVDSNEVWQFRHRLKSQKCSAVSFLVEEIPDVSGTAGFEPLAVSLEIGAKSGLSRLKQSRTV